MNKGHINKIIGAIFILISSILYATDRICLALFYVASSSLKIGVDNLKIDNIVTIVLSCIFFLGGIYLILKRNVDNHGKKRTGM